MNKIRGPSSSAMLSDEDSYKPHLLDLSHAWDNLDEFSSKRHAEVYNGDGIDNDLGFNGAIAGPSIASPFVGPFIDYNAHLLPSNLSPINFVPPTKIHFSKMN